MKIGTYVIVCLWAWLSFADAENDLRIIGGTEAVEGQAPYQCSMQFKTTQSFCGCSILDEKWILTAAHCFVFEQEHLTILVGTNDLSRGGQHYKVSEIIPHKNYHHGVSVSNDIGLIRVEGTIKFSALVQPIRLSKEKVAPNSILQLTGWGRLSYQGKKPNKLQTIELVSISDEYCRNHMSIVPAGTLCTLNVRGEGACNGDSGGPLTSNGKLVGIVSFGTKPCAIGYPDVFTAVSFFYDWIYEQINANTAN